MQNYAYADVENTIGALAGVTRFEATEKRNLKRLINRRARQAYRRCDYWPRYLVVGQKRLLTEDGLVPGGYDLGAQIDTFLRIHVQEPFKRCSAQEYRFFPATFGTAQVIDPCLAKVPIDTINSVVTEGGQATLSISQPDSTYWASYLFNNSAQVTISGIEGTPFDDAINGDHDVLIDYPDTQNLVLTFYPDPSFGEVTMILSGTISPGIDSQLFNTGTNLGKTVWTNNGVPINELQLPDGDYIRCYWTQTIFPSFTGFILVAFTVVGGVSTPLGQWSSTQDVATPDLVTFWVPNAGETGTPKFNAVKAITNSSTVVNGKVAARACYVTYKKALTDTFGIGDGENPSIPREWADFVIQGTYADWLRAEGQTDKAAAEEAMAEEYMLDQLQEIEAQGYSQTVGRRIWTNLNSYPSYL